MGREEPPSRMTWPGPPPPPRACRRSPPLSLPYMCPATWCDSGTHPFSARRRPPPAAAGPREASSTGWAAASASSSVSPRSPPAQHPPLPSGSPAARGGSVAMSRRLRAEGGGRDGRALAAAVAGPQRALRNGTRAARTRDSITPHGAAPPATPRRGKATATAPPQAWLRLRRPARPGSPRDRRAADDNGGPGGAAAGGAPGKGLDGQRRFSGRWRTQRGRGPQPRGHPAIAPRESRQNAAVAGRSPSPLHWFSVT